MIFETVNSLASDLKHKAEDMMLTEPAGTTICLVEQQDLVNGVYDQITLILYPIGGTVSRTRTLRDRMMSSETKSIGLPVHVTQGTRDLSDCETDHVLKTLGRLGIWKLPHSKENGISKVKTTVSITNGRQSHAFAISDPEKIYQKLQAVLLSLVTLPRYSL